MREMKDSGVDYIGHIPATWNVFRNKNAFICSKDVVGEQSSTTQLLSLTTKGVKEKDINNAEGKLPESFDTYQFVDNNDLVMCLFDLDVSAVFSGISHYEGMISPAYKVISCNDKMNPKYADYWFQYISHGRKFNHYAKNIRFTLNIDEFQALPMIFPPLDEQERIADFLDSKCSRIDEIITKLEQIIEKLKEYKLSVITEAVTKGLDPNMEMKDSGVEWIGKYPAHWSLSKIKQVALFFNGDRSSKYPSGDDIVSEGILFVTSNNLGNIELDTDCETNKYITREKYDDLSGAKIQIDDIVFCLRGSVGKCGINKSIIEGTIASSLVDIRPTGINPDYLNLCLHNPGVTSMASINAIGIGSLNLSAKDISEVVIPIPSIHEQEEIVNTVAGRMIDIEGIIAKNQEILNRMYEYKKSLIYEVVTGKKEV